MGFSPDEKKLYIVDSGITHGGPAHIRICFAPDGDLIGKIHLPETCANLTFGGVLRDRLYMCAGTFVYALYVNTQGAAVP